MNVGTAVQTLFDFGHVDDVLVPADAIVAFGNHDLHVAQRAAELYLAGLAPVVLFTGGFGRITKHLWHEPEALRFARVAQELGVPAEAIITEPDASNTGENIERSRALLARHLDVAHPTLIMVDRPYRGLRTRCALEAQWPDATFLMASPHLDCAAYATWYASEDAPIDYHEFASLLVGDLQRNLVYGEAGLQTPITVPDQVEEAFDYLVAQGYTDHLLKA